MRAVVELPFIKAGVVQVDPLVEVAYTGAPLKPSPTATNRPLLLTATEFMLACVPLPFIAAGVVQVDPLVEVAYRDALLLS
jgi:hypothetical protein